MFISRAQYISRETMAYWIRKNGIMDISSAMIDRLVVAAKTYIPGKTVDIVAGKKMLVGKDHLKMIE